MNILQNLTARLILVAGITMGFQVEMDLYAQVTEAFTGETAGSTTFSEGVVTFSTAGAGVFKVASCPGCGSNGFGDDDYLEAASTSGNAGEILLTSTGAFILSDLDIWLATTLDGFPSPTDGFVTFRGTLFGGGMMEAVIMVNHGGNWKNITFSGTPLDGENLTKLEVILDAGFQYVAIDDFRYTQLDPTAVNVTINDITLSEGNSGSTAFQFTVTRSNDNSSFNVTAASADGSASSTTDYMALPGTLVSFMALTGVLTKTVTVNVSGDFDPESDEDFFVNLTLPTNGATILDPQGKGTILDDDTVCETFEDEAMAGLTAFAQDGTAFSTTGELVTGFFAGGGSTGSSYYLESDINNQPHAAGSVGEIQITTAGKVFTALQVDLWLSTDADANDSEIGDVTFTGTLAAGGPATAVLTTTGSGGSWSPNLTFAGTPLNGALLTALEVSLPTGGGYVAIDNFKFASFDNTAILVSIDDVCMNEGNMGTSNFTFTVSRSSTTTAFAVDVQSAIGVSNPATAGVDYTSFGPVTLNFAMNGASSQTVDVVVRGDTDSEVPETFLMNLSNPTNGALITDGQGLGTIKDDDTSCETFEDEGAAALMAFSEGGVDFTSDMKLITGFFAGGGATSSDYYLESDNTMVPHSTGSVGVIQVTSPNTAIKLLRTDVWLSADGDINTSEIGTIRLIGTLVGGGTVMADLTTTQSGGSWSENLLFSGTGLDGASLTSVDVVLMGSSNYVALDNICFEPVDLCALSGLMVAFTAPADLCLNAGVQAGLAGGTPSQGAIAGDMGLYAGPGVTDDGNGMTYSFDPAVAGVGTHSIMYTYTDDNGCSMSASDDVEVFALPTLNFTAPPDICIDAGVQTGQGGGTPPQGSATGDMAVYAGPGVTDDGNGMTYSFDPAAAGVGTHTITYTYTDDKGCSAAASDMVEVFPLPLVIFTAPPDICIDAGVQTGLGGGTPPQGTATGDLGVYSGPGVTDDGNGMTYSFDPAAAGVGTHTITYTYTDDKGCSAAASDMVEVFPLPVVMFTAPADLCIDAGVQTGLGGGTPHEGTTAGDLGVYSGPGVTDDGNGMTYGFDPAAAGVGTHTITYTYTDDKGCSAAASDMVEVFALPVVMFTAPADLCIDAGVQTGQGGGTPPQGSATGDLGVYSGPGVTDDGNGMTYSFDPVAAGVGTHTITYTYTDDKGCSAAASDMVEVFALPVVMFTAPADLCIDAGVQVGLGGGTPPQGSATGDMAVYAGPGVTDDGNGMTYSFDPATAGVGTHTITYTYIDDKGCSAAASDMVEVFALPVVMFTAPADLCIDAGVQTGQGGGTPPQGSATGDMAVYAGPGVTDDGNGMTYSFDPAAAGVGTHTITYTYTDDKGCSATASDMVEVFALPVVMFTAPADLCIDAGVQAGQGGGTPPQGSATGDLGVYSGPGVTDDGNGMTYSFDPVAVGVGTHTITYTYTDDKGCSAAASDMVEVFALPVVMFTAPADLCIDAGVQAGLGGGTPPQGSATGDMAVYAGPGVTDDGNGMTYSFDPLAAGLGTHIITYTYTNGNGCVAAASDDIGVGTVPTIIGTIQGPVKVCPLLKNLVYAIDPVENTTSYTWSFSNGSAAINGTGTSVSVSFDDTFAGGTLSLTANNSCGPSTTIDLELVPGSTELCELATCLSENEALIIDNTLINQLDVFQNYNRIESDGKVDSPRNVTFKAGNEILLEPPFEVALGATFIAEIESCLQVLSRD